VCSVRALAGRLATPILVVVAAGLTFGAGQSANRVAAIHQHVVFADMHAHPSRFHRANVPSIEPDELARYRRGLMDIVVCNISTDAVFSGDYVKRDGTDVKRGELLRPKPGEPFAFTLDRFARIIRTTYRTSYNSIDKYRLSARHGWSCICSGIRRARRARVIL
jgi:hypothetical protein